MKNILMGILWALVLLVVITGILYVVPIANGIHPTAGEEMRIDRWLLYNDLDSNGNPKGTEYPAIMELCTAIPPYHYSYFNIPISSFSHCSIDPHLNLYQRLIAFHPKRPWNLIWYWF